jgi:hypothetical protein
MALTIGISAGAGGIAWATVACGSFDATTMELISVRKSGQNQPLPAQRSTTFENDKHRARKTMRQAAPFFSACRIEY